MNNYVPEGKIEVVLRCDGVVEISVRKDGRWVHYKAKLAPSKIRFQVEYCGKSVEAIRF